MRSAQTLLRNVALMSAASYVEMALGLVLGIVVARSLGREAFGHYALAVWAAGTLMTLCNNALTSSAIRFVAEARGAERPGLASAVGARLSRWQGFSTVAVLATFALWMAVDPPDEWRESHVALVPLLIVGTWSRSAFTMLASVAKGYERFEVESVASVASTLVNVLLVLVMARVGATVTGFFAVYAVCGLVQYGTARTLCRRLGVKMAPGELSAEELQRVKRHLAHTGVLVVVGMLGNRTFETLLLQTYTGTAAVGYFAIAGALTKGVTTLLAGAMTSVLLPAMSHAFGRGGAASAIRTFQVSMRHGWFLGVTIAGLGLCMAPGAVRLLYGPEYEPAVPAVVVCLAVSAFVMVSSTISAFQTASDQQASRVQVALVVFAINLVVCLMLVPEFGLPGALWAYGITRFMSMCISWRFARHAAPDLRLPLGTMCRVLAAAALACAAAEGVSLVVHGQWAFLVTGASFLAAFLVLSFLLRCWLAVDYDVMIAIARRVPWVGGALAAMLRRGQPAAAAPVPAARTGKRDQAAALLGRTGIVRAAGALRSSVVGDLRIIAYHRVLPELDESTFAYDVELVSATQHEFDWQMKYIARNFVPVSSRQVADACAGGPPLPRRAVMVTFDDGFRDNHDVAFPILKRHGVPALFFLSTGYIGAGRHFWFDWLVHVVMTTPHASIRLLAIDLTLELGRTPGSRRAAAATLQRALKRVPDGRRRAALCELAATAEVETIETDGALNVAMTWDQVRAMSAAGMEFGSHTVSHPILSMVDDPLELRREIADSRAAIEREVGRPAVSIAYPVGGRDAVSDAVVTQVREAGYEMAFSYRPGVNKAAHLERYMLRRFAVERYTTRAMFSATLQLPELFGRPG